MIIAVTYEIGIKEGSGRIVRVPSLSWGANSVLAYSGGKYQLCSY